jgi:hypothetical protein
MVRVEASGHLPCFYSETNAGENQGKREKVPGWFSFQDVALELLRSGLDKGRRDAGSGGRE